MAKETIEALVEGGKASAAPPLGPALGPLGVNIGEVIAEINKKTGDFKGMKVPVKVIVDSDTKEFSISVGTPPVSQLIKKELNLKTASGVPNKNRVANMAMEQAVKVAKMKKDALLVNDLKAAVKTVLGSCNSMGVLVEGKPAVETCKDIDAGVYDDIINNEKTEVPEEKAAKLKEELSIFEADWAKEMEKKKAAAPKEEEKEEEEEPKEEENKKQGF